VSREQDVKVLGRVVEQVQAPDERGLNEILRVNIDEQNGTHISGRHERVTARSVPARQTLRMKEAGVCVRIGDRVWLLVNPWTDGERINQHVCAIIAIAQYGHRGPDAAVVGKAPVKRAGGWSPHETRSREEDDRRRSLKTRFIR
jgi:hypothetical protein